MRQLQRHHPPARYTLLRYLLWITVTASGWLHAEVPMSLTLTSQAFSHNRSIPSNYTCQGRDTSPPLRWEGVPANAQSLVLIVEDPDAPDPRAPKMTWIHWVLYNLPADTTGLHEDMSHSDLPEGAKEGLNSWHHASYGGPCPPIGEHRYFFRLYALDRMLDLSGTPTKAELLLAMKGHVIESAELIGLYHK